MKTCTCGEVKAAMEKSIRKWERVVEEGIDGSTTNGCGLCDLFNIGKYSLECEGCPVREHSGEAFCRATPFFDYADADDDEKCHAAAKKELKFLKMLYHKYFVKGVAL